jgi:hypothetical protein
MHDERLYVRLMCVLDTIVDRECRVAECVNWYETGRMLLCSYAAHNQPLLANEQQTAPRQKQGCKSINCSPYYQPVVQIAIGS